MTMPTNTLPSASQLRDYSSSPNIPHVVTDNGDGTFTISPQAGTSSGGVTTASEFTSGTISNADIDSLETVAIITTSNYSRLMLTFTVATAALTDFNVDFQVHASGDFVTIASVAADYTSPEGPILGASSDLTVAGTSGTHWLQLDVTGVYAVRIQAAGTSSVIAGHYGMGA